MLKKIWHDRQQLIANDIMLIFTILRRGWICNYMLLRIFQIKLKDINTLLCDVHNAAHNKMIHTFA